MNPRSIFFFLAGILTANLPVHAVNMRVRILARRCDRFMPFLAAPAAPCSSRPQVGAPFALLGLALLQIAVELGHGRPRIPGSWSAASSRMTVNGGVSKILTACLWRRCESPARAR